MKPRRASLPAQTSGGAMSQIDAEETVSEGAIRENCRHISLMKTERQNTAKLDVNSWHEQFKLDENENKYRF